MKTTIKIFSLIFFFIISLSSCEKENEEGELEINFRTGNGYTYEDALVAPGSAISIGIEAETSKPQDPIIRFNISESINGGTPSTIYTEDINTSIYSYNYSFNLLDTISTNTHTYTFTITNRDGINAQKALTLTIL